MKKVIILHVLSAVLSVAVFARQPHMNNGCRRTTDQFNSDTEIKTTNDSLISALLPLVNPDSMQSYVRHLQAYGTRFMLSPNHKTIAEWLLGKFVSFGYGNARLDSFQVTVEWPQGSGTFIPSWQYNVYADLEGAVSPQIHYIAGAHYDAVVTTGDPYMGCPGADDNGSGCAAVLEIARILKENNYIPPATLRFVLFAAEELGTHGSKHYTQEALSANECIGLYVNMDMIGHEPSDTGWRIQFNMYEDHEWAGMLGGDIATMYTQLDPFYLTFNEAVGSDSDPFFLTGYPAIFLQEDVFCPYYHSLNDADSNIRFPYCAEIARAACGMLMKASALPGRVDLQIFNPGDGFSLVPEWSPNPENDIAGYRVFLGTASLTYDTMFFTTDTSLLLGGLNTGIRYYIGVIAVNLQGGEGILNELYDTPVIVAMDQGVLIIDDSEGGYYSPSDSTVDGYYRYICRNFDVTEYDAGTNGPPGLADLGPFSSVVWHINNQSAVPELHACTDALKQYVQLGGNVFFTIFKPSKMLEQSTTYPQNWHEGSFIHDILKIDSINYLTGALFDGAVPYVPGYNTLELDTLKTPPWNDHHITSIEALYPGPDAEVLYLFDTDFDSLTPQGCMKGFPVGIKYHGAYNAVILSFPLFYIDSSQAFALMNHVLEDVFGEVPFTVNPVITRLPGIHVFPNPSDGSFVIGFSPLYHGMTELLVLDNMGRKVREIRCLMEEENHIDLSELKSGVYYLKAINSEMDNGVKLVIFN